MESPQRSRQASLRGGSRASPGAAPPGSPQLQIPTSPQEDHQETQAGGTGSPAAQLGPRRGVRTRDQHSGSRRRLWRFCLRTSRRSPSTPSPLPPPAALFGSLQGPAGSRTPRPRKLRPPDSRDVPVGRSGRRSRGVGVLPSAYARGGGDGRRMERLPSSPSSSQPAL